MGGLSCGGAAANCVGGYQNPASSQILVLFCAGGADGGYFPVAAMLAGFRRELRLIDALFINIGTILASAAFVVPALVVEGTGSAAGALGVWVAAGVISLCGAFAIAELSALYPFAGGTYVYLERAYHPLAGFLYGWSLFAVIQTASIAAVAVVFVEYAGDFAPLSDRAAKAAAIVLILGLSLWNCRSVRASARTQNLTTVAKLAIVGALIALCVFLGDQPVRAIAEGRLETPAGGGSAAARWGAAMIAALWAYDGWISITFVGGEVRNPNRFLPRAITLSLVLLIGIYVALNFAYLRALPLESFAGTSVIASDAARSAAGPIGGHLVSLAVMVSCFAAANGFIFTGARVYYAMAADKVFLRSFGRLSDSGVPRNATVAQGLWASAIALTGTYDQLFTYVVVVSWLFYGLGSAAVIVLRWKRPDMHRPWRTPLYPLLPALFTLFSAVLLVNTVITDPRDALIGLGITAAGIPFYLAFRRRASLQEA